MKSSARASALAFRIVATAAVAAVLVTTAWVDSPVAAPDNGPGRTLTGNYLAGRHAQSVRDLGAAANFLDAALKLAPDAPDLLRRTFILMAVEGRMKEAVELAQRLLAPGREEPIATLMLAVHEIKRARYSAAQEFLDKMPKDGLSSFMAPILKAWVLMGEKKGDEALAQLTPGGGEKSTMSLRLLHAALISEIFGHPDAAEKYFQTIVDDQKSGLSFRVVQLFGGFYERSGKPDKAQAIYERYRKEQPDTQLLDVAFLRLGSGAKQARHVTTAADGVAEAMFDIASSLTQQNARETAMVLGRLALYLKPDFPVMQILLGDILEADNRLEQALGVYNAVNRKSPYGWSVRLRSAALLDRMDRADEAVKTLREMARENTKDDGPLVNLGDILRGRDRFKEAVEAYDEAIKRIPKIEQRHWTLFYARGIALERSGQWQKAEADFLKALEYEPKQPYVLNYLGYTWIERNKNLDKAQDMIREAVKLRPNDGYIVDSLGWGYYQLRNFQSAVQELERAVELRPQDAIINDHLGDAYWQVGRRREAEFQWKRSLSLNPDADLIPKLRKKLKEGLVEETKTAKKPKNG